MGRRKGRSKGNDSRVRTEKGDRMGHGGGTVNREAKESEKGRMITKVEDHRKKCVPIDVRSRLTYPLVRPFLSLTNESESWSNESSNEEEEEERIELKVKPRFVFVSSLCSTCLERSKLFCERCRMVSYCSSAHRTQGWSKHRELCEPLTEIRSLLGSTLSGNDKNGGDVNYGESEGLVGQLNAEQYRVYRLELLAILESKISRPLELWEKEIVLYPRICRVCRRFGEKLICCARCGMECFCKEHGDEHEKWCDGFQVLERILVLQHRYGCVNPKIPKVGGKMWELREVDFDETMHRIYRFSSYYREMDCYTYSVLSHVSTIPLTALYSMEICCPAWQDKTDWTIHVVGAEFQFEGMNLEMWEKLFLHLLPKLKRVRVTLVGPELHLPNGVPPELLSRVKVCKNCKSAGKEVIVSFRPETLYHDLFRGASSESVIQPADLICAFNPGLYRKTGFAGRDTWAGTIREFCERATPVVVTSYTADEMYWDIARINSIADVEIVLQPRRNPFASIKPDRNFVSDNANPLIYKNYYISIVKGKSPSLL
ncbi:Putative protein MSS51 homolog, mitochondrial [Anthophora plagiata]